MVRSIIPVSWVGVLFLLVRTFSIFSFVFFLLSRSQVTFSKLVPLACSLKPLTLDWKSFSFLLLILSHFLWRLFLSAIIFYLHIGFIYIFIHNQIWQLIGKTFYNFCSITFACFLSPIHTWAIFVTFIRLCFFFPECLSIYIIKCLYFIDRRYLIN